MEMMQVCDVTKTYTSKYGSQKIQALKGVTFTVEKGEFVAIMGESGSGKTTLLNIIAALDSVSSGKVIMDGAELSSVSEKELASFRRNNLGFVFQEFNLLDTFTLKDNILLPLVLGGENGIDEMNGRLEKISEQLGIRQILNQFPFEVSGGQKQRAAVARALITNPKLILADEPTGALDSRASSELLQVFKKVNESGQTILMVTHSVDAASHAGRILFIRDGVVFHQIYRGECSNEQLYKKISDTLSMLRTGGNL